MADSISPREAVDLYMEEGKKQFATATCTSRWYHLKRFIEWCEDEGIDNMNSLTGRDLYNFKIFRRNDGINNVTQKKQLTTLRLFLRFCEQIEYVPDNTAERVMIPHLKPREDVRETLIDAETGELIIQYLTKFEYASSIHIVFHLLWHTGMRTGTLHSLDVEDFHEEGRYLEIHHRPRTGTPLKNKENGEREINLNKSLTDAIADYLSVTRPDIKDEFGRNPLLTTRNGRADPRLIQKWVYKITRPCEYTGKCPFNREIDSCEAMTYDTASKCPSSISPHPIRRSAITAHLKADVPKEVVSERSNVSIRVIDDYYDFRSEAEKRENRQDYVENII